MTADDRYFPSGEQDPSFKPTREQNDFAQYFSDITELLDQCDRGEDVALLLSTCRNMYLAMNAIFVDLASIVGRGPLPAPLAMVAVNFGRFNIPAAATAAQKVSELRAFAQHKRAVWGDREDLVESYETGLSKLPHIQADRVRLIIDSVRTQDETGDWAPEFYRLDPHPVEHLIPSLDVLDDVTTRVMRVERVCRALINLVTASEGQQQGLFEDTPREDSPGDAPGSYLATALQEAQRELRIQLRQTERSWLVLSRHEENLLFEIPQDLGEHDLRSVATPLGTLVHQANDDIHKLLCEQFRPNVGRLPMPHPFQINLVDAETPNSDGDAKTQALLDAIGEADTVGPIVRLAAVTCGIGEHAYDQHYRYTDSASSKAALDVAAEALRLAHHQKANVIVFPEYFLPRSNLTALCELADELDIPLIGGVEGRFDADGKLVNEALVRFPNRPQRWQRKQWPSVYEEHRRHFLSDGKLWVFHRTRIGTLGVLVCSDLMELDLISALATVRLAPDVIVVLSRNPHPEHFRWLAAADAIRFYAHVVVVNSNPNVSPEAAPVYGSSAASPVTNPEEFFASPLVTPIESKAPNHGVAQLELYELSLADIAGRHRERPAKGYLPVPRCRRPN